VITGGVSDDGVPVVTLPVADRDWPAVIDTGFNGDLELPETLRDSLDARFVGRVLSTLAGGAIVEESAYLVEFPFDGRMVEAEATFVEDSEEILVGTCLLREYRLEIDFPARTVKLQRA
jgi:predicted aspartyl protease